ncbi:MAG TPA: hypothetical protein VIW25_00590 [Nitrososphaeraceae archaeon]
MKDNEMDSIISYWLLPRLVVAAIVSLEQRLAVVRRIQLLLESRIEDTSLDSMLSPPS